MCLFMVLLCVQGKQLNKAEAEPGALLPHSSTATLMPCGDFIEGLLGWKVKAALLCHPAAGSAPTSFGTRSTQWL